MTEEHQEENTNPETASNEKIVIPVIEERIIVDKKWVQTGKVSIAKIASEENATVSIPLEHEEVQVERVAWNIYVDTPPPSIRYEGDVMIISVLKEVAVVQKKMMLVEELRITRVKGEKTEKHEISLRKEEVKVTRSEL